MSGTARIVSRITAGLSVLLATLFGSAAYASQPGPDPVSDGIPSLTAVTPTSVLAGPPVSSSSAAPATDYVSWALSATVALVLVAAIAIAATALYRRHRLVVRQLQMP
jgi:hypothetical protein